MSLVQILNYSKLVKTGAEARRMMMQGAVSIDGVKLFLKEKDDPNLVKLSPGIHKIQLGKKFFHAIIHPSA